MLARSSCHLAGYGKVGRRDARPFEPGPGVARFRNVIHSSAATNPESAAASDVPFGLSHRRGFLRPQLKSQKWTGKYGDLTALGCHLQTQPPRLSDGLLNG